MYTIKNKFKTLYYKYIYIYFLQGKIYSKLIKSSYLLERYEIVQKGLQT